MEYQILANKWRPKSFNDVVGQNLTIDILKKIIENKKIHNSFLIIGSHGTGKTTIARILAKCLNCNKGITINPCNECQSCINIDKSNDLDVIEIDAASKTKVEDIREIINSSKYTTNYSKYKIYIIDEVHMLSLNSFNALLKTLEEPNKNVKFILITTNIEKIPLTITSRCLQFQLEKINKNDESNKIIEILNKENIKYEKNAINIITTFSQGSLRDTINTLEKIIIKSNNLIINKKIIEKTLGIISNKDLISILYYIKEKKRKKLLKIIDKIYNKNIDFNKILIQLKLIINKIIIIKFDNKIHIENRKIKEITEKISIKTFQKYYKILLEGEFYIKNSPNPKIGFEMIILKIFLLK